jgi:hypothetical protein
MSKAGRLGLIALAAIVVVVAFVVLSPGDDDDDGQASNMPAQTGERSQTGEQPPTATAPSAPKPPPDGPDRPREVRLELTGHEVEGGVKSVEVTKGERVRFVVTSDEPDDIHVHGYDVERPVGPETPTTFGFRADIEGIFEVESHQAEHVGKDPLIARLVVEPS